MSIDSVYDGTHSPDAGCVAKPIDIQYTPTHPFPSLIARLQLATLDLIFISSQPYVALLPIYYTPYVHTTMSVVKTLWVSASLALSLTHCLSLFFSGYL